MYLLQLSAPTYSVLDGKKFINFASAESRLAIQSQQQAFYLPNRAAYVVLDIIESFTYEKWVSLLNLLVIQIVQC